MRRGGHGGRGSYGYGLGYGGSAFLGGLGLGYALDAPYYDSGYYPGYDYGYGPGPCLTQQQVWDPYLGRYVIREVPC